MGTLPVLHPPTRGVGKRTQASKPLAKALRALAKALSRGVYTFTKMFQNLIFSLYVLVWYMYRTFAKRLNNSFAKTPSNQQYEIFEYLCIIRRKSEF